MAKKQVETFERKFCNPFAPGVNYKMFTDAMGSQTVAEYCKGHLEPAQIEWLIEDLKHYTKK